MRLSLGPSPKEREAGLLVNNLFLVLTNQF